MIMNKRDRAIGIKYLTPYSFRILSITVLAIICALFEAVNLGALVPLLQIMNGTDNPGGTLWDFLNWSFSLGGIQLNFTNLLLVMAALFFIGQVLLYTKKRMQARMWFGFSSDLKKTLFNSSMKTDIGYHHSHKTGDLIDMIARQSENGANVAYTLTEIFTYFFFILIYVVMLLYISIELTFICVIVAGACLVLLNRFIRYSRQLGTIAIEVNMQMNSFINERLHMMKLIRTFSTENLEDERFRAIREAYSRTNTNFLLNGIKIETLFQVTIFSVAIIILYISTVQFQMDLPLLLVFVFILIRLTDPLRQLNSQRHVLATQFASLEKVDEIITSLEQHTTIIDGTEEFGGFSESIKVADATFTYPQNTTPVIRNISFYIGKNRMVALVGASGGGKSTLVDLLIRLIEPQQGEILIDSRNVKKFTLESYHRRIGFVSQDSFLFNDTILNNICYGNDHISKEDAISAAKLAHAHDFIMGLPDQYETVIGEKGAKLSGGQKQRLSLARALYKKPDILILDEATSALDSDSEKIIQESIAQIKNRYTIIAIAHRISTIRNADKIMVIEKGQVVETGSHDELIQKGGVYANYYQIQYDQNSQSGS
ncbi:MAG: ABC transporter ATP-binding protein [Deltaproteobacteria bacterium]|nr:ABC transporter ATP-binding protein [Deltaproteobacteria bacterium]